MAKGTIFVSTADEVVALEVVNLESATVEVDEEAGYLKVYEDASDDRIIAVFAPGAWTYFVAEEAKND